MRHSTIPVSFTNNCAMKFRILLASFFLVVVSCPFAFAGGPLQANGTSPVIWDIENNGPVTLTLDRGSLGQFDSAEAYAIMLDAVLRWDTISTASVQVKIGGHLDHNVTSVSDPILTGALAASDGIIPVVYDETGAITDAMLGAGASAQVLGFALPETTDNRIYTEGRIVMVGSNPNRSADRFLTTMTHELGHLLGLSHSQHSMRGITPIMYPSSAVGTLHDDDVLAISMLYPADQGMSMFGSLEGQILDADGNPMSGLNIVAVDSVTRTAYATVSDYYSGGLPRFVSPPARDGSYRFELLPPGVYFIRVEGINPEFASGSRIASYNDPINNTEIREWYNGEEEGGSMLLDGLNDMTGVRVESGATTEGIDIVLNDITSLDQVRHYQDNGTQYYGVPQTYQGVRAIGYAVRFEAPQNGSPTSIRVNLYRYSSLPENGTAVISVHRNNQTPEGSFPGTEVGVVTVPLGDLATNQLTDIWLYGIGSAITFAEGDIFFISVRIQGPGRLDLEFDREDEGASTYYQGDNGTWNTFPMQGNNGGTRVGNLKMDMQFSPIPSGTQRVLASVNPEIVLFDSVGAGARTERSAVVRNAGTVDLRIDEGTIEGTHSEQFTLLNPDVFPFVLKPGEARKLDLAFSPDAEGARNAELKLSGNTSRTILLQGWGKINAVQMLVPSLDFGTRGLNASVEMDTTIIYNRGDIVLAATVKEIAGGDDALTLRSPNRSVLFQPGDSLDILMEFLPTEERDYTTTLAITFSPPRDTVKIVVTGRGKEGISSAGSGAAVAAGTGVSLDEVRPNPVRDEAEVVLLNNRSARLKGTLLITDVAGRVVQQHEVSVPARERGVFTLKSGDLPTGSYRVVFRSGETVLSRHFLIVR